VCHGDLATTTVAHAADRVLLDRGGMLGGLFNTLIAPSLSKSSSI
jgi:hypothetical protein